MIKQDDCLLEFLQNTPEKIIRKFNGLFGSNSRPFGKIKKIKSSNEKYEKILAESNVYFDKLELANSDEI